MRLPTRRNGGNAGDQIATQADLAYLESANLTSGQVRDRLKDLQGLPPLPPMADKIDLAERFMYLDSVQMIRRGGVGMMEVLSGKPLARKPTAVEPNRQRRPACLHWRPR